MICADVADIENPIAAGTERPCPYARWGENGPRRQSPTRL